jgi:hypothetical protein
LTKYTPKDTTKLQIKIQRYRKMHDKMGRQIQIKMEQDGDPNSKKGKNMRTTTSDYVKLDSQTSATNLPSS